MLNRDLKFGVIIILLVLLMGCRKSDESIDIILISKSLIGTAEYDRIYNQATDSIKWWGENKLEFSRPVWALNARLDSTLCFNKGKNKMIGAILVQCNRSRCLQDDIHLFYGAKIKEQWYFFIGENLVLAREAYQEDRRKPLGFNIMHEIAIKKIFKSYLIKNSSDEWEVNDKFFAGFEDKNPESGGYGNCLDCKSFDEYVLHLSKENWRKKAKEGF
ncbi:MAG TPA: hypothetical protein VGD90_10235 [Sphingobacteriaceae bacterium]